MSETVRFDHRRPSRIGLPESVYCEGKDDDTLESLFIKFAQNDTDPILFTRLSSARFHKLSQELQAAYDYDPISGTAWHQTCEPRNSCQVAIVSAGTSDASVVHEAARTLKYLGWTVRCFEDCGVAGLWRLQEALPEINNCDVVIAVAGMDAALVSVLGGLTSLPIIAVPTSVGYGVSQGGHAALTSMLSSCAPGICVMNIDNGYGAACAAARLLNRLVRHK